jgi:hypothetical protein
MQPALSRKWRVSHCSVPTLLLAGNGQTGDGGSDALISASAIQVRAAACRLSLAQADLEAERELSAGLVPRVELCSEVRRAEAAVQAAEAAEADAERALREAAVAKREAAAARSEAAESAEMVERLREELKVRRSCSLLAKKI